MRAVFVNHCHPDTPHVCATRLREFAYALTALGHEVILLTEVLESWAGEFSPEHIGETIQNHDFSTPLYLATTPKDHPLIKRLRDRTLPWGLRQAVIVWYYFWHKGVFTDWRSGTQPVLAPIAEHFKPDIVWASFGNTDCWNIAKDLAALVHCPWVADLKDLWRNFIPALFQGYLGRHFDDCAGLTTFSDFHSEDAEKWFSPQPRVIYSGFSENLLVQPPALNPDKIILSLTGAIYDKAALSEMVRGVQTWVQEGEISNLQFVYAGHDTAEVKEATGELAKICNVDIKGYLPLNELRLLHQNSIANLYIKSDLTFHHKTIEMLSAGRPLICYSGETKEAIEIAQSTSVPLYSCTASHEISAALVESLKCGEINVTTSPGLKIFTWETQAQKLESMLQDVIKQSENQIHA